jgi:PAS domain-containing protein
MNHSETSFGELSRNTVERSKNVIFLVDAKMRITYCNPAWDEFALANGGEHVVPHESSELT